MNVLLYVNMKYILIMKVVFKEQVNHNNLQNEDYLYCFSALPLTRKALV